MGIANQGAFCRNSNLAKHVLEHAEDYILIAFLCALLHSIDEIKYLVFCDSLSLALSFSGGFG
jgi:hypothetical protein